MTRGADAPDVLICAGLDPSGGAGLIADVRVVSELGCRPVGVVTALTVQNTTAVVEAEAVAADRVREQLEFLLSDVEVRAVKIGMLGATAVAEAIARALALTGAPVVWDPIVQPSRGVARFDGRLEDAVAALAPHVTVLTPNAGELAELTGTAVADLAEAREAGRALAERLGLAVLVKGGHLGGDESVDLLCHAGGVEPLHGPRTPGGEHVHGTGCALSSALAAHLARGLALVDACRAAKAFVAARIAAPVSPGRGARAIV
ncbi:MAG TPA: bifunctional hydroxymethylpyrimidine kinase/phosphomethylpyrimidine kinase [Kofleriaceae bacterium]